MTPDELKKLAEEQFQSALDLSERAKELYQDMNQHSSTALYLLQEIEEKC